MAREINLVPDIKNDMIRTLKLRNFIFFVSIVIVIACVSVLVVFGTIAGGQEIAKNSKDGTLKLMSAKLEDNKDDLKDYLTIRNQLTNIRDITSDKQVLSRTFNILSALLPTGADTITISELNVNLDETNPTFSFDAQANAGREPFIDYNVLDSFKKSMEYMYYDYGTYVDKEGMAIPAYCMIENAEDGTTLNEEGDIYALWTISAEGCNPSDAEYIESKPLEENGENGENGGTGENGENGGENPADNGTDENGDTELNGGASGSSSTGGSSSSDDSDNAGGSSSSSSSSSSGSSSGVTDDEEDLWGDTGDDNSTSDEQRPSADAYETELYGEDQSVVRIWRTPQFDEWYEEGYITTDGQISGVPHFNSECITYAGEPDEKSEGVKWSNTKSCKLVPSTESQPGIRISDSSNGRGAGDELVLRFSAVITLAPEVYAFSNTHVLAIPPADRVNVTDSYVQIQNMFGEAARDCDPGDTACTGNTSNLNGGTN